MPKNLKYFLLSLVVAGVALLAAVQWIGTGLIYLAFLDPQREQPYLVIQGGHAPLGAQTLTNWLEPYQGQALGVYEQVYMAEGRESDQLPSLAMLKFEQASDVVRVVTDSDYPLAESEVGLVLGSYDLPGEVVPPVLVVWLLERAADQLLSPLVLLDGHSAALERIFWQGAITSLQGPHWQDCVLLGFASQREATAWLNLDETQTLRRLTSARSTRQQITVYSAN
ncbi:MAG: hypothetical protein RIC89_05005 [Pseudomonadales bacterium]